MLISYSIILMNSLISSTGFLADYLGFYTHTIMSQANRHIFISPYMPFLIYVPFFHLIAMTGTSNIMINKGSENKHLCHLDPNHRRKVFILSSSVTLTVFYQVEEVALYSQFSENFSNEWYSTLSNAFSATTDIII